jgi:hypothetical protein
MIHVVLFLHLFLQPQAVAPPVAAKAKVLLQSGIDAENRQDLDRDLAKFRKAANCISLRLKLFCASAVPA